MEACIFTYSENRLQIQRVKKMNNNYQSHICILSTWQFRYLRKRKGRRRNKTVGNGRMERENKSRKQGWVEEETMMRKKHSHWERKWNLVVRNGTDGIESEILGNATNRGEGGGERERENGRRGVACRDRRWWKPWQAPITSTKQLQRSFFFFF